MDNYRLYRIGQFIAMHTPLKLGYALAVFFSDVHYFFAVTDKRAVLGNLKAIFPHKSERELCRIRHRMFRNFAKYLVDFFRFSKVNRDFIDKKVRIENRHLVDKALAEGKGAVALTAHLGNWELGGAAMGILEYPFWAVALEHKDKEVNDFFVRQREQKGIRVIPFSKASRLCIKALKDNGILALVGDRDFSENGIVLDFFGKKAHFPEGPAILPLLTKAAVIPGFMLRNSDDTFTLHFEKPIEVASSGDRAKDAEKMMRRFVAIFESYIRKYPDQWYMFRRFWIE